MICNDERDITSFCHECLERFDVGASACVADIGIAYRAWVDDPSLTDMAVADMVVREMDRPYVRTVWRGGSAWIDGVQVSPIGEDMVIHGVQMHQEAEYRAG